MGDDQLSPAEVESLLDPVPTDFTPAGEPPPAVDSPVARPAGEQLAAGRVASTGRFGNEQLDALRSLHEQVALAFEQHLSKQLRRTVQVSLTGIEQPGYSEFIFSLDQPTCVQVLRAEALRTKGLMDISFSILYPIIECLLGAGKQLSPPPARPPTEIERRLLSRVTGALFRELSQAWEPVLAVDFAIEQTEINPQKVRITAPSDVVVVVRFAISLDDATGAMQLCLPFRAIEPMTNKLASGMSHRSGPWHVPPGNPGPADDDGARRVDLTVMLGRTRISPAHLEALRVGDIITTDTDADAPLEVVIDGEAKFSGRPGVASDRRAIRIEQSVSPNPAGNP